MQSIELLYADVVFRLTSLDWLGQLDLFLVAAVIFTVLTFVRRSRAAFMLRGALGLGLLLLVVTILLPLPTFDWLIRGVLLLFLVGTPMILQPELRRWLEQLGRSTGLSHAVRQTTVEAVLPKLLHTVESLAASRTGALIVLEGDDPLNETTDSGIRLDSRISHELLHTIFFDKTPLHDGAVVIRGDRVLAASCVLPLTNQNLTAYRRLGTRHRAAVGMSEASDSLVVVVSEETGHISVARKGVLHSRLEMTDLRQEIYEFMTGVSGDTPTFSWRQAWKRWRGLWQWRDVTQVSNHLLVILLTVVFTLSVWFYVLEQTNATERPQVDRIALRIEDLPPGLALVSAPPTTVSVLVRTTQDQIPYLNSEDFQAMVSLSDLTAGLQKLPIQVNSGSPQVQVLSVDPPQVTLELALIVSRTIPIVINITDRQNLSSAYEVVGTPTANPAEIIVTGPAPQVTKVSQIQLNLSLSGAAATIRETRPLRALDEQGQLVNSITLSQSEAQAIVVISRKLNARDVAVRAVTTGTPPPGYWLNNLSVTPANVTLQGDPLALSEINGFVDTEPVDVSQAFGPLSVQMPLQLPEGVTAVTTDGSPVFVVTVNARVTPRSGDLLVTRPIELVGLRDGTTVRLDPVAVDLLIRGPLPTLAAIEANPDLIQLLINVSQLAPGLGQVLDVMPEVTAPEGVTVQLVPSTVLVTLKRSDP